MTTTERGSLAYFIIMAAAGWAGGVVLFVTGCDQAMAAASCGMGLVGTALFVWARLKQGWWRK